LLIVRAVSLPWDLAPSPEADREWVQNRYIFEISYFLCTGKMAVFHPLIGKRQQRFVRKYGIFISNSKGKIIFLIRLFSFVGFYYSHLLVCLLLVLTLSLVFSFVGGWLNRLGVKGWEEG
jgi:hypothetical protein